MRFVLRAQELDWVVADADICLNRVYRLTIIEVRVSSATVVDSFLWALKAQRLVFVNFAGKPAVNFYLNCRQNQVGANNNHHSREDDRIIPIHNSDRKIFSWNKAEIFYPLRIPFLSLKIYEKGVPKLKVRNCNHASHKGVLWTRAERYCEHNYLSEGQRALLVQALLVRWAHRLHHNQQHDDSHIGEGKLGLGLVFRVN